MSRLKFKCFLITVFLVVKAAGSLFPAIKAGLKGRNCHIRIQAGKTGHTFSVENSRLIFSSSNPPTSVLDWEEPGTALAAMTSGYDGDMIKAARDNQVRIHGEAVEIFWFFSILKEIRDILTGLPGKKSGRKTGKKRV
ncbi:MAG: hypothetical protein MI863_16390 [Desulfobacterales bacterium]|nr:hypothetical protein [Desulfobacterales bacterium]